MQVQIIESNRGGKIALQDGHSYNQKQSTINCIHWRCTKYYKLKCPAILKTTNETVTETKGTHNHECDPGECKAKEVGLKTYYENFPEFNLALRMLPALAHVPPIRVKASFELVIEEIADVNEREQFEESVVEKMDELAIYFKSTYIENPIVNKKPPFPIEMWNQYDAAGEGVARTTNSVEG